MVEKQNQFCMQDATQLLSHLIGHAGGEGISACSLLLMVRVKCLDHRVCLSRARKEARTHTDARSIITQRVSRRMRHAACMYCIYGLDRRILIDKKRDQSLSRKKNIN